MVRNCSMECRSPKIVENHTRIVTLEEELSGRCDLCTPQSSVRQGEILPLRTEERRLPAFDSLRAQALNWIQSCRFAGRSVSEDKSSSTRERKSDQNGPP